MGFDSAKDGGGWHGYGLLMGFGQWHTQSLSFYDAVGSSYAAHTSNGPSFQSTMIDPGPWLRSSWQIPKPSRTIILTETKGVQAPLWHSRPGHPRERVYAMGNHGILRRHNIGFCDGHAKPIRFEARDDIRVEANRYVHTGEWHLRGGRIDPVEANGLDPGGEPWTIDEFVGNWAKRGDDWQNHCFPAPPTHTTWGSGP